MAEKPVITIPEGEPPAELLIDDEIVGEGEEAVIGKRVIVHCFNRVHLRWQGAGVGA